MTTNSAILDEMSESQDKEKANGIRLDYKPLN